MGDNFFPVPRDADSTGATTLTWFAGLAMQALIMHMGPPKSDVAREEIALWALRMAQTMIATERRLAAADDQ